MGNTVTVEKGNNTEVFEDVLGHQVGNGAIQILERNGNQRIINNYDEVWVELDEEASNSFEFDLKSMEAQGTQKDEGTEVGVVGNGEVVSILTEEDTSEEGDGTTQH